MNDATAPAPARGYFEKSRDLTNSIILIIPMLVIYEAGLLLGFRGKNGVDFLTDFVIGNFGWQGLVTLNLVLIAGLIVVATRRERDAKFDSAIVGGVLLESTVYAWFLGTVIIFIMRQSHLLAVADEMSVPTRVIVSFGAGVHEEIVFRLLLLGGIAYFIKDFLGKDETAAFAIAFVVSSLLFSLAHHLPGGEPFAFYPFVYRFFAGLIFATIYHVRGLAVAVYTHAIYDILVLVFR